MVIEGKTNCSASALSCGALDRLLELSGQY